MNGFEDLATKIFETTGLTETVVENVPIFAVEAPTRCHSPLADNIHLSRKL